jgi:hypothetical protein
MYSEQMQQLDKWKWHRRGIESQRYVPPIKEKPPEVVEAVPVVPPKPEYKPYRVPRTFPELDDINEEVCAFYGVAKEEFVSKLRLVRLVRARQVAMSLAREMTPLSLPIIGREIGKRDHTTVIHASRKIQGQLLVDRELLDEVECIANIIKHRMAKRNELVTA